MAEFRTAMILTSLAHSLAARAPGSERIISTMPELKIWREVPPRISSREALVTQSMRIPKLIVQLLQTSESYGF